MESGAEIHVNDGMNHFDGISALAFCRERQAPARRGHGEESSSRQFITAIIKKMMSPAMLRGASDIIDSCQRWCGYELYFRPDPVADQYSAQNQCKNGIFIPWQRMEPGEQISAILQEMKSFM